MKQASNSLLILHTIPFMTMLGLSSLPRDNYERQTRRLTPFIIRREGGKSQYFALPVSCSPRSIVRSWLGEERIRSLFHSFFCLFLGAFTVGPFAMGAPNVDVFSIALQSEAAVQSDVILLKDVAELTGKDSIRIQQLGQIKLGSAPAFGSVRTFSRYQITEAVRNEGGSLPTEGITGANAVQIRFQGRPADPKEIMELLRSHLVTMRRWQESEIRVDSIGNLSGIELPPGPCKLQISSNGLMFGHRNVLVTVEIMQNGRVLRSFWITAGVRISAGILTAARKISSGESVAQDALLKKNVEIADLRADYARNPEDVIGKMAIKTILPGEPLTLDVVKEPFLIKHGETVNLRLERNGIILNSTGRAEQDGRLGQVIRVRNIVFSTVLKAQVTGRAQAVLQ
jgi:flagellar basal body P-ring formation protein FlgA